MIAASLLTLLVGWQAPAVAAQLTLTWAADAVAGEEGFAIERASGTAIFGEIAATGPDVTSYVDSGLAGATSYCYRVRAFNEAGSSDYSNTACAATAQMFGLAVLRTGAGSGTVTSSPAGITCGGDCSGTYPGGTAVTLTASTVAGSTFSGWTGGGCSGASTCTVTLNATTTVSAAFAVQSVSLAIGKAGAGTGSVTSSPAGINCGSACTGSFPLGSTVSLSAGAATGSTFSGWSGGGCAGIGACLVSLGAGTAVTATFALKPTSALLTVTKAGGGSGTVTSAPGGIDCGTACSSIYPSGTVTTLAAVAGSGSVFAGWSGGGCSGTGACAVTLTAATAVTATFTAQSATLTVALLGSGSGAVTSTPGGIACGATCVATYPGGTAVSLLASPAAGSSFAGWSGGGCTGAAACITTPAGAMSVSATFDLAPSNSFTDSFQRPDSGVLGMGWIEPQGDFFIRDGTLLNGTDKLRHLAVQSSPTMATGTVRADFTSLNNNAAPVFGLVFGYVDALNYHAAYRQVGGTSMLKIVRVTNGVETVLGQRACANPARGVPFALSVSVSSSQAVVTGAGQTLSVTGVSAPGNVGVLVAGGGTSHVVDEFTAGP